MTNPITGLIHLTGEPDTGKTTFALTCGFPPEQIAFFDDDLKTQPIADALKEAGTPFGAYYNLTKLSLGMRELQFHDLVIGLIDNLPRDKFKVVIFDTWTRFENTFQPVIQKSPAKFREFYSPMGAIKGAEMWKASFDYETAVIDKLNQAAPLVIIVTHLKDQSVGSVKTGKEVPDCKKPIVEKSRIRLWLRHNPDGPAPIGLVLKRLSKIAFADGTLKAINVLPRKISPCTWGKILDYWKEPIADRVPEIGETPNPFELSILDGVLTEDQKDVLHINRVEADKPVEVQRPALPETPSPATLPPAEILSFTLDQLCDMFGADKVMEANGGMIPASQEEVDALALKLAGA